MVRRSLWTDAECGSSSGPGSLTLRLGVRSTVDEKRSPGTAAVVRLPSVCGWGEERSDVGTREETPVEFSARGPRSAKQFDEHSDDGVELI